MNRFLIFGSILGAALQPADRTTHAPEQDAEAHHSYFGVPRARSRSMVSKTDQAQFQFRDVQRATQSSKRLVVLGPIDSGTHLLIESLEANFPGQMNETCQSSPVGCRWLWKHSLGTNLIIDKLQQSVSNDLKQVSIIAIIRAPLAQVYGWTKDPWDLAQCVNRSWTRMDQPCQAHLGPSIAEQHVGVGFGSRSNHTFKFESTMHVYNQYLSTYSHLQQSGLFRNVLVVRYEDLLLAPEFLMKQIGVALGWSPPKTIRVVDNPAKKHGFSHSRTEAIRFLRKRTELREMKSEGVRTLCRSLQESGPHNHTIEVVRVPQNERTRERFIDVSEDYKMCRSPEQLARNFTTPSRLAQRKR